MRNSNRLWEKQAIALIEADFNRSADTHLIKLNIPSCPEIDLYLKDESTHPTGSLKHRLARSLFLYGICNGWIKAERPVIEASSGSTAVSEAYFARMLNLPFIAVMPACTSQEKIDKISFYGGRCHLVENAGDISAEARRLAQETDGHFIDQFTYAERATDWRGNNNIAESIFAQMADEPHPIPRWLVMSAGTGGTSATLGRHARYHKTDTKLCVVDPDFSAFYPFFNSGDCGINTGKGSRIEGIGRPTVEPSFMPDVIDRMIQVPDAASIAAIRLLEQELGRKCGGSTGTNLYGSLRLASEMKARNETGSIVTLICDSGERYLNTYYNDIWCQQQQLDISGYKNELTQLWFGK
ncbi:PLP-dependent cysteine synthase family protein [Corallincola holothuriorum]|uniref:L-cysteine desulfhydrase Cds1 n=1 Tax=Corallincola holothuriorum TaxID=2282215 RepID=A0A368NPL8_9GAMM|nr:PLP-dependent cysteine synthase family protein [Corallincola holothuriorum]RCU51843.1 PLP-dependent cysteine synthase family protein [Corallincola holothuriorum]